MSIRKSPIMKKSLEELVFTLIADNYYITKGIIEEDSKLLETGIEKVFVDLVAISGKINLIHNDIDLRICNAYKETSEEAYLFWNKKLSLICENFVNRHYESVITDINESLKNLRSLAEIYNIDFEKIIKYGKCNEK